MLNLAAKNSKLATLQVSQKFEGQIRQHEAKIKTALSLQRSETYKTGGGVLKSKMSCTDERIASLLRKAATGLSNHIDSEKYPNEIIEIDFLESEFDIDPNSKPVEEIDDKNIWSKWKPSALKKQKSEKLNAKKITQNYKNELLLDKQTTFFINEDRRAENRHILQMNELRLKEELLKLDIIKKKL